MHALRSLAALVGTMLALAAPATALELCTETQANTWVAGVQSAPAVAMDPTGRFLVVWTSEGSAGTDTDDRSIQARRYDAAGTPLGAEVQVNTYTTGRQSSPSVAMDAAGRALIVWDSAGSPATDASALSVQARALDADGAPLGDQFQVNAYTTGTQRDPRVVADDADGFVVVWESAGSAGTDGDSFSIQARRATAAGPAGPEFQVNAYTTGYQVDPDVARDGATGFVVVWVGYGSAGTDTDSTSIQARRLDLDALPLGADFQVNGYTTSYQDYPRVAPVGPGGFAVVWRSNGSAGGDTQYGSIQARRFDATGSALGAQFQVNVLTTLDQREAGVAADGAGGFVVVWDSAVGGGSDTSGWSIQGRRYDAAGAPAGAQFQVNAHTPGSQYAPSLGADGGGGFVVAWQSPTGSGGDPAGAVQTRRLHDVTCTPPTTTTTVTSSSTSSTAVSSTTTSSSTSSTMPGTSTSSSTSTVVSTSSSTATSSSSSTATSAPGSSSTSSSATSSSTPTSSTVTTTTLAPASSTDLVAAKSLKIVEARSERRPPRTGRAALRAKDPAIGIGRGPASPDDPTAAGGSLRVVSLAGAFDVLLPLPPDGWKPVRGGYRYRDASGVRVRVVPGKKLQVRVKGPAFALGTAPAPVVVVLRLGEHRLCAEIPDGRLNASRGRFVAGPAAAPALCAEPAG